MTVHVSIGAQAQLHFPTFDIDGETLVSGLENGDFDKFLAVDGAVSAVASTVSEVGATGRYTLSFTPPAAGMWYAEVTTPAGDVYAFEIQVNGLLGQIATALDSQGLTVVRAALLEQLDGSIPGTVGADAAMARMVAVNRLEVVGFGGSVQLVLYDDDDVAEVARWNLSTNGGEPVVTSLGVQTRRSGPV